MTNTVSIGNVLTHSTLKEIDESSTRRNAAVLFLFCLSFQISLVVSPKAFSLPKRRKLFRNFDLWQWPRWTANKTVFYAQSSYVPDVFRNELPPPSNSRLPYTCTWHRFIPQRQRRICVANETRHFPLYSPRSSLMNNIDGNTTISYFLCNRFVSCNCTALEWHWIINYQAIFERRCFYVCHLK